MDSSNKSKEEKDRGSILILTLLVLMGTLSIGVAISAVSVLERKMTTKSRRSVSAFQAANAGVEWAMKKINEAQPDDNVLDVFPPGADSGEVDCPGELFSGANDTSCKVILLKRSTTDPDKWEKISDNVPMKDLVGVRVRGFFQQGSEEVNRALEAYAMPNCDSNEERVADFCVERSYQSLTGRWGEAIEHCATLGKRLCSAAELRATQDYDGSFTDHVAAENEWTADASSNTQRIYFDTGGGLSEAAYDTDYHFRCCRNR